MTSTKAPAVVNDPASARLCLNINMYESFTWPYIYNRFKDRFGASERRRIVRFMQSQTEGPFPFLQTRLGDGRAFSREESEAIQKSMWDNAEIFNWRQGDVLLLNNVRFGHGRLNVVGEREIYAILAAPYDVRDDRTNWFKKRMPKE